MDLRETSMRLRINLREEIKKKHHHPQPKWKQMKTQKLEEMMKE